MPGLQDPRLHYLCSGIHLFTNPKCLEGSLAPSVRVNMHQSELIQPLSKPNLIGTKTNHVVWPCVAKGDQLVIYLKIKVHIFWEIIYGQIWPYMEPIFGFWVSYMEPYFG